MFADWLYSMRAPGAFDIPAMPQKWREAHQVLTVEYQRWKFGRDRERMKLLRRIARKTF